MVSKPRTFVALAAVFALATLVASAARGASSVVVYDNFGPGDTFNTAPLAAYWHYSYADFPANTIGAQYAFSFTPTQTATLDKIYLPLDIYNGNGDEIMIALLADDNGKPGFGYYQQSDGNLVHGGYEVGAPKVIEYDPFNKPLLEAGKQYWVAARLDNFFNTSIRWYASTTDTTSPYAATRVNLFDQNFRPVWYLQSSTAGRGAFRVTGIVPEPTSLGLLAMGAGMMLRRR